MGNCCARVFRLFSKKDEKDENEPLIGEHTASIGPEDLTISSPHHSERLSSPCQESRPGLSFHFGTPLLLQPPNGPNSSQCSAKAMKKQTATLHLVGDAAGGKHTSKDKDSDEEGYSSSFEAISSLSKGLRARKPTNDESTIFEGDAKEKYEAEVDAALAFIQEAENNAMEGENLENLATDNIDYYSI